MKYRTIVADPPWRYQKDTSMGAKPGAAEAHYRTMGMRGVAALPIGDLAEDDAHLYLWVTVPRLYGDRDDRSLLPVDVMERWGFEFKTMLTWVKDGSPGMGWYFRGQTEHVLFGVRGNLPIAPELRRSNYLIAPRAGHSGKPDAFLDLVEQVSPGPYLELFARRARFGWDYWGDESLGTAELGHWRARMASESDSGVPIRRFSGWIPALDDPAMPDPSLSFTVLGKAQPAGSKKAFAIKRKDPKTGEKIPTGKVAVADDNPKVKSWQQEVRIAAIQAKAPLEDGLWDGPLSVAMTFYVPRLDSHHGTGRNAGQLRPSAPAHPTTRPDLLKLARGVEDALTGVVWTDDSRIVHETLRKEFGEPARVEVTVAQL